MQFQKVVVGVDFSDASCACARWTVHHFARGARITLVHVLSGAPAASGTPAEAAHELAEHRCSELRSGLLAEDVEIEIVDGPIPDGIARVAQRKDADLIAIGKHGAGEGAARGVGSVAEQLILHPMVPVLLGTGIREGPPRSILAAIGDDPSKVEVVRWARWLSERFEAACVALSVVGSELRTHLISMAGLAARGGGVSGLEFQERDTEIADGWIAELSSMGSLPETSLGMAERGHTVDEVVAAAERLHSDLIVLGSRQVAGGVAPDVSVACGVARRSACPVFIVKPEAG